VPRVFLIALGATLLALAIGLAVREVLWLIRMM
jgi:hypothetical protein